MKKGYIFSRLFMIFPTVITVIVLSFLLFNFSGADPVASTLALQGLVENERISTSVYKNAYNKEAKRLGRDLPQFYLSIVPSYHPDTLHKLISPTKKSFAKKLLHQYKNWETTESYLIALESMYKHKQLPAAIDQVLLRLSKEIDQDNLEPMLTSIQQEVNALPENQRKDFLDLQTKLGRLDAEKNSWFYPVVKWHGGSNQFHLWFKGILSGNFGEAMVDGRPVWAKIWKALLWSFSLSFLSIIVASVLSLLLGFLTGFYQNSIFDKLTFGLLFGIYSIPLFWFATIMIVFFTTDDYGKWTNIFPSVGLFFSGDGSVLSSVLRHSKLFILPIFCVALHSLAYLGRQVRTSLIEEKNKAYYLTALAKGMSPFQVLWKHSFMNALIPFITIIIGAIPSALAGSLIVEVLFNIPGMGRLMYDSILNNDWNVISGILILISIVTVVFYFIGDLIYSLINPRMSFD